MEKKIISYVVIFLLSTNCFAKEGKITFSDVMVFSGNIEKIEKEKVPSGEGVITIITPSSVKSKEPIPYCKIEGVFNGKSISNGSIVIYNIDGNEQRIFEGNLSYEILTLKKEKVSEITLYTKEGMHWGNLKSSNQPILIKIRTNDQNQEWEYGDNRNVIVSPNSMVIYKESKIAQGIKWPYEDMWKDKIPQNIEMKVSEDGSCTASIDKLKANGNTYLPIGDILFQNGTLQFKCQKSILKSEERDLLLCGGGIKYIHKYIVPGMYTIKEASINENESGFRGRIEYNNGDIFSGVFFPDFPLNYPTIYRGGLKKRMEMLWLTIMADQFLIFVIF